MGDRKSRIDKEEIRVLNLNHAVLEVAAARNSLQLILPSPLVSTSAIIALSSSWVGVTP